MEIVNSIMRIDSDEPRIDAVPVHEAPLAIVEFDGDVRLGLSEWSRKVWRSYMSAATTSNQQQQPCQGQEKSCCLLGLGGEL